jgi:hypothetical protein
MLDAEWVHAIPTAFFGVGQDLDDAFDSRRVR